MKHLRKFSSLESFERGQGVIPRPWVAYVEDNRVVYGYKYTPLPQSDVPLYVEAIEDLTVKLSVNAIEYSLDNAAWTALPADTATPTIAAGSRVYFRASGLTPSSSGIGTFTISAAAKIGGNIMSMIAGEDYVNATTLSTYAFRSLFKSINIRDASRLALPATTLAEKCYSSMFSGCTALMYPPELPATTLATGCYSSMFYNCTALMYPPELPATTLASECYSSMFSGCTALMYPPELPATTLASKCYREMFYKCTSLICAPVLPATTLVLNCYSSMFYNCTALKWIKAMFTDTPFSNYTGDWLSGVAATGTFVKNAAATWDVTGASGIPEGWTVETASA